MTPRILVSGATRAIVTAPPWVGRFVVPASRSWPDIGTDGRPWAGDNGCLSTFDPERFIRMLEATAGKPGCLFMTAPDVVRRTPDGIRGDAAATLAKFSRWSRIIRAFGFPVALVLQDGITPALVPWAQLDAVFVGGSTAFKYSRAACDIVAIANARGVHTHMGRVAGPGRWHHCQAIGIQTIDSSGFSRFFSTMERRVRRWHKSPRLPFAEPLEAAP